MIQRRTVYIMYLLAGGLLGSAIPTGAALAQLGLPGAGRDILRVPRPSLPDVERVRERTKPVTEATREAAEMAIEYLDIDALDVADTLADIGLRTVETATDELGQPIEAQTVVVALDPAAVDQLAIRNVELVRRQDLPGLGLAVITLRNTGQQPLATVLEDLRTLNPDVRADYNHLYDAAESGPEPKLVDAPSMPASVTGPEVAPLRIGLIDTEISFEHEAFANRTITRREFVAHQAPRPTRHGTAVASLLVNQAGPATELFAASIFFTLDTGSLHATTSSLIAALDWLATVEPDVINMSLAGPGNLLLEIAVERTLQRGNIVVAAVGNRGPNGSPEYPAAYAAVIAVTAVDAEYQVYRYAGRGAHVDFAALGVDVTVADATNGGWRMGTGTSLAAPLVAWKIAELRARSKGDQAAIEAALTATVLDLGAPGHDPVYGNGLIADPPALYIAEQ